MRGGDVVGVGRVRRAVVAELGEGPVVAADVVVDHGADAAVDLDRGAVGAEVGGRGPVVGDPVEGDLGVVADDDHADGAVVVELTGGVRRHPVVVVQVVAHDLGAHRAGVDLDAVHVVGGLDLGDHVLGAAAPDAVAAAGDEEVGDRDVRGADHHAEVVDGVRQPRLGGAGGTVGADRDRAWRRSRCFQMPSLPGNERAALEQHPVTGLQGQLLDLPGPGPQRRGGAGAGRVVVAVRGEVVGRRRRRRRWRTATVASGRTAAVVPTTRAAPARRPSVLRGRAKRGRGHGGPSSGGSWEAAGRGTGPLPWWGV